MWCVDACSQGGGLQEASVNIRALLDRWTCPQLLHCYYLPDGRSTPLLQLPGHCPRAPQLINRAVYTTQIYSMQTTNNLLLLWQSPQNSLHDFAAVLLKLLHGIEENVQAANMSVLEAASVWLSVGGLQGKNLRKARQQLRQGHLSTWQMQIQSALIQPVSIRIFQLLLEVGQAGLPAHHLRRPVPPCQQTYSPASGSQSSEPESPSLTRHRQLTLHLWNACRACAHFLGGQVGLGDALRHWEVLSQLCFSVGPGSATADPKVITISRSEKLAAVPTEPREACEHSWWASNLRLRGQIWPKQGHTCNPCVAADPKGQALMWQSATPQPVAPAALRRLLLSGLTLAASIELLVAFTCNPVPCTMKF